MIHTFPIRRRWAINKKGKPNDKYNRILKAAAKVFARRDFYQATVAQIAAEAGVADGTIYLYFRNKDDILIQIFNHKARQVFERFRQAVERAPDAVGKLRNLVRSHLYEFERDRNMAILYQTETHRNNRMVENQIKEISKLYLDIVSEIVEQGQQEDRMRKDLYMGLVKRFILGAVDEVINTWLHSEGAYNLQSMADPLVELFLHGIGCHANLDSSGS